MQLEAICNKVCLLTDNVGKFIQRESNLFTSNQIEVMGKNDFVSYVDKTAEQMLVEELERILPEAGFIAEENTSSKVGKVYNWVIDPLDGTTNFLHRLPCYSISIGLLREGIPVLGVGNELNLGEVFYAWEHSKAYLNKTVIAVSQNNRLENALIATGFPYTDYERLPEYLNFFRFLLQETHGVRRLGSAAVDLAYVACGRFDAFYEYGLKPWDVAGGAFIVQQAGGKITDFKGEGDYLFGKELIASSTGIYDALHANLIQHFTK